MSLIWLCVQVCLMHQFLHFQSVSVHEPLPCFNVINHTIKTNNSSSAPRLFCPLYIKNKSASLSLLKWLTQSHRVSICPVRRGCASFRLYLDVCLRSEWPLMGGQTSLWGRTGQMDGRGDSATDTEHWGSSVAAATWPPFLSSPRLVHFLSPTRTLVTMMQQRWI